jgi:hypothetical protein
MTPDMAAFANALREVLGLGPLYHDDRSLDRTRARSYQ